MTRVLKFAGGAYDRTEKLRDGGVTLPGFAIDYAVSDPGSTFQKLFREHAYDVAEMSFSTYTMARATGADFPYIALPIPLSRVFGHGSIYIRTDRGMTAAADLKGKRIGLVSYHFTRGLVVRGMLADEYGVQPADIHWVIGGMDRPEDFNYVARPAPPGVRIEYLGPGDTLSQALLDGRIDAIISYKDPQVFIERRPNIGRLFPDFGALERDWFRRTGIFPIMHLVGVRQDLVREYPELPLQLCRAYAAAKAAVWPRLFDLDALHVALPFLVADAEATARLMGDDFWPYGVARNRPTIDAQTRWSHEQGLAPRRLGPAELFTPETLDWAP